MSDVRKIFVIFDPLPPCLHLALIHSIESTQPPLLCLLLGQPPPPPPSVRTSFMDVSLCLTEFVIFFVLATKKQDNGEKIC